MKCTCGSNINENAKFCNKCGTSVESLMLLDENNSSEQNESTPNDENESNNENKSNNKNVPNKEHKSNEKKIINKKSKANKVYSTLILCFLLVGIVFTLYYTKVKNAVVISHIDSNNYPVVVVKLTDAKGNPYTDDNLKIYEDGQLIDFNNKVENQYTLMLDFSALKGDTKNIAVSKKVFGLFEVKTNEQTFEVTNSLLQGNFENSKLVSEKYPKIVISTNVKDQLFETKLYKSIVLVILSEPLNENNKKSYNFKEDFKNIKEIVNISSYDKINKDQYKLLFEADYYDRTQPMYYTLAFDLDGVYTDYKDYVINFKPLANVDLKINTGYENVPNIMLTIDAKDKSGNSINKKLDLNKFKLKVLNKTNKKESIQNLKALLNKDGKIVTNFDIEDANANYSLIYQDNFYGFNKYININRLRIQDALFAKERKYNKDHKYEVVYSDVSWEDALKSATKNGGYLARVGSQEELDAISKVIEKSGDLASCYWVAGTNNVKSSPFNYRSQYYWVNEDKNITALSMTYSDLWLENQPSYQSEEEVNGEYIDEDSVSIVKVVDENDEIKWYFNDFPNDIVSAYPDYKGKVAYIVEYEK